MKVAPIFYFMFTSMISYNGFSQVSKKETTANDKTEKFAYVNVTKTYERIAEKGYRSTELFEKLGNAFYEEFNMEKAAKWYGELFAMTKDVKIIHYDQYAKSLYAIGENVKADAVIEEMSKLKTNKKKK